MTPMNPYAPPQEVGSPSPHAAFQGFGVWQSGGQAVMFRTGAMLPARCVVCNAPGQHKVSKTFFWHEPWLYILALAGWLIYAIVALIVRKSANIDFWLCDAHRTRRTLGMVIGGVGFTASLFGMFIAAGANSGVMIIVCLVLMIALPVAGAFMARVLTPARIDDSEVRLKAGADFVASLPQAPQAGSPGYGYGAQQAAYMGNPFGPGPRPY